MPLDPRTMPLDPRTMPLTYEAIRKFLAWRRDDEAWGAQDDPVDPHDWRRARRERLRLPKSFAAIGIVIGGPLVAWRLWPFTDPPSTWDMVWGKLLAVYLLVSLFWAVHEAKFLRRARTVAEWPRGTGARYVLARDWAHDDVVILFPTSGDLPPLGVVELALHAVDWISASGSVWLAGHMDAQGRPADGALIVPKFRSGPVWPAGTFQVLDDEDLRKLVTRRPAGAGLVKGSEMGNVNPGGMPADHSRDAIEELEGLWGELEKHLAAYLSTMVDPDEADHLTIEVASFDDDAAGCRPYAQFAAFAEGQMIRAEMPGNVHLLPHYHLDDDARVHLNSLGWRGNDEADSNWWIELPVFVADMIANHVISALRAAFGIAHPQQLTYKAWGPAAAGAQVLGLCATGDVPADEPHAPIVRESSGSEPVGDRLAFEPVDRDDLVRMVESLLREKFGGEPTVDEDGDFVLHHMRQRVWVRVFTDQPAIEIVARVAHDVHSRRAAAVEIGLLNRDTVWTKWTLRDRSVWQAVVLSGKPFVPSHLFAMLDIFLAAMTSTRDDLAYRLRGKVG